MEFANHGSHGGQGNSVPPLGLFTGGTKLTYAPAAGASNNVNPGGLWPSAGIGRIDVNTAAGACNFTGLVAAIVDGQGLMIRVTGANNLTLNNTNVNSLAANRFAFVADLIMTAGDTAILVYDLTLGLWVIG